MTGDADGAARSRWRRMGQAWSPREQWGRFAALVVGCFVMRGLALLCVMPPFEGWDEYQHVAYIRYLEHEGRAPVLGAAQVPADLLEKLPGFGLPTHAIDQLGAARVSSYAEIWADRRRPDFPIAPQVPLYEAQHPSLYYRLVSPLFAWAGGTAHLAQAVAVLRFANVLLGAAAIALLLAGLGRICVDRLDGALIGLVVSLSPLLLQDMARVANDALGLLAGTVVVIGCFALGGRRVWLQAMGLGAALGIGILVKATDLALAPLVAASPLLASWAGRLSWRQGCAALAMTATVTAAITWPYFASNLAQFGLLIPMQEAVRNQQTGHGLEDVLAAAGSIDAPALMERVWGGGMLWGGGWSFVPASSVLVRWYRRLVVLGVAGWVIAPFSSRWASGVRFDRPHVLTRCAVLAIATEIGLAYHAAQSQMAWGAVATCPWYGAPAFVAIYALLYRGWLAWPRVGKLLAWSVPLLMGATELTGVLIHMPYVYSGGARGWEALRRLAHVQPALLGTTTLTVAAAAAVAMFTTALIACAHAGSNEADHARHLPGDVTADALTAARRRRFWSDPAASRESGPT